MKRLRIILTGIILLTCACTKVETNQVGTNEKHPSETPTRIFLNVPQLIGKPPVEVEKVVGPPIRVEKITNDLDMMPGEYRDYKIPHTLGTMTVDGLWVRYYKGVAHLMTLDLPEVVDTPEEALLMAGIDVKSQAPRIKAPAGVRWSGNFNGIEFKDVAAFKLDAEMKKYSTVQAELTQ